MKDIDHANVVRLFEVYRYNNAQYFVMELCTGGHLGQVLREGINGRLDEAIAKNYIAQIVEAIAHCHRHGICHRDIKLQNILRENKGKDAQVKIIDFGNGHRFLAISLSLSLSLSLHLSKVSGQFAHAQDCRYHLHGRARSVQGVLRRALRRVEHRRSGVHPAVRPQTFRSDRHTQTTQGQRVFAYSQVDYSLPFVLIRI